MSFGNVDQRIFRLLNCERVGRASFWTSGETFPKINLTQKATHLSWSWTFCTSTPLCTDPRPWSSASDSHPWCCSCSKSDSGSTHLLGQKLTTAVTWFAYIHTLVVYFTFSAFFQLHTYPLRWSAPNLHEEEQKGGSRRWKSNGTKPSLNWTGLPNRSRGAKSKVKPDPRATSDSVLNGKGLRVVPTSWGSNYLKLKWPIILGSRLVGVFFFVRHHSAKKIIPLDRKLLVWHS